VADHTSSGPPNAFGGLYQFHEVFQKEIDDVINLRRAKKRRQGVDAHTPPHIVLEGETKEEKSGEDGDELALTPQDKAGLVGLSLSGGGIRSAAFCLGALQALDAASVLERVDYLSTVSGGGYIGCSLTASLEQLGRQPKSRGWQFPYRSELQEDEPPALQHIRDYSNYLFPHRKAIIRNASIYARGLAVNVLLIAPFLLAASAFTLALYWLRVHYPRPLFARLVNPFALPHFFFTVDLAIALVLVGIAWGLYRSTKRRLNEPEIPGGWIGATVGSLAILLFVVAFCDAQPLVLAVMAKHKTANLLLVVPTWITNITVALAPVATVVTFLAGKLGEFIKSTNVSTKPHVYYAGILMRVVIYIAGLIVPLGLWLAYLGITYSGLLVNGTIGDAASRPTPWQPATWGYLAGAAVCIVLALLMRPNANSLHPLYRDRLARAFLFKLPPVRLTDLLDRWRPKLSDISAMFGPYHLINTALNVEASKTANRRGRNADFFFFSPQFVGSKSTGYVRTGELESVAVGLDLATAMAASGAAVSSNMGAQSIKPLTASMALLNVRLGYWMRNPNWLRLAEAPHGPPARFFSLAEFNRTRNPFANYYFLAEIFGLLSDKFKSVYLTDGGHIENLGIYELLRRRCQVIIAVDAEADSQMAFGSFNSLERYALIDMGIRIDLPWQKITNESLATGEAIDEKGDAPKHKGPHCAIGEITYPKDRNGIRKGILVYIKASLTGDENDYIFDYKRRHGDFPHETTLDQWFTEEQFEAYRALGFHAAYRLFSGKDKYAFLDLDEDRDCLPNVAVLNEIFGGAAIRPPEDVDAEYALSEAVA
jgi:predicted acylesterase/phospholipase RssA